MSVSRTGPSHNQWPTVPVGTAAQLRAAPGQLNDTQWLAPDEMRLLQDRQLTRLLDFTLAAFPFWKARVIAARIAPNAQAILQSWHELPPIRRAQIQSAEDRIVSDHVPPGHAPVRQVSTTGTQGRPLTISTTNVAQALYLAFALSEHDWQQRDVSRSIVAIRPHHQLRPGQVRRLPDWGQPVNDIQATGECVLVHPTMTIERQAELIVKKRPGYLLAKAANVDALVDHVAASGQPFDGLKQIRSFGEPVSYELRERARNTLGVEIADIYSATEIGMIAFQCREYGSYHIQCEGVRAEVVDDEDAPCPPGKEGRLLLTPLHHFAMPLLRCEIMDRVVQGQPCACGRGLVTIDAVIGRQRNMAVAPGGGRYWPSFPYARFSSIAPIKQIQLIQRTHASIEVHYQLQRPPDADESIALGKGLAAELGYVYQFTFVQHPEPIHDPSGKYQDFICLVDE